MPHVYRDAAGVPTIGYGHVLLPGEAFPAQISQAQGMDLMTKDLVRFEIAVTDMVKVPLTQSQFDALVSFTYNVGAGALNRSLVLERLNEGNYRAAADLMLIYDKRRDPKTGALVTDSGLAARRAAERGVFLSGTIPPAEDTDPDSPVAIARSQPPPGTDDDPQPTPPEDLPPPDEPA